MQNLIINYYIFLELLKMLYYLKSENSWGNYYKNSSLIYSKNIKYYA